MLNIDWLTGKDFLTEEVGNILVRATKRHCKAIGVCLPAQGEDRQLQSRDPPLGTFCNGAHAFSTEVNSRGLFEEP